MRRISLLYLLLALLLLQCKTQTKLTEESPGYLGASQLFEFYNHFWLNLHHFLYNKAEEYSKQSITETIPTVWQKADEAEKNILEEALKFYKDHIIEEDLRTGDNQYAFKSWVINQKEDIPLPPTEAFQQQIVQLNKVQKVYQKYWWTAHEKANQQVLEDNKALIEKLELPAKEKVSQMVKANWQEGKIRVDICVYGKSGRPYTSTEPTHIVMNARLNAQPAGNWFELLIHEASHHFIFPSDGFVGETIMQAVEETGVKAPRGLWHGYLFYFTGKASQQLLEGEGIDYELYMVRRKVFHWFYPLLDQYLPAYLEGQRSLLDCSKQIILDFDEANRKKE